MHEDGENSREFKLKFRAGNHRLTNFETFPYISCLESMKLFFGRKEVISLFFNR